MEKKCVICGKTYENRDKRSVICSNECYKVLMRERYKVKKYKKPCKMCGEIFEGTQKQVVCEKCLLKVNKDRANNLKKGYERKKRKFIVNYFCRECGIHYKDDIVFLTRLKSKINEKQLCPVCLKIKISDEKKGDKNPNYKKNLKTFTYERYGKLITVRREEPPEMPEETSARMKKNNPMFDVEVREKVGITLRSRYENGEIKVKTGKDNPLWKGNRKPSFIIRTRLNKWVRSILERDDFTCKNCGLRGGKLEVHHIESFSSIIKKFSIKPLKDYNVNSEEFEKLIQDVIDYHQNNDVGITYCVKCHSEIDKKRHIKNEN